MGQNIHERMNAIRGLVRSDSTAKPDTEFSQWTERERGGGEGRERESKGERARERKSKGEKERERGTESTCWGKTYTNE